MFVLYCKYNQWLVFRTNKYINPSTESNKSGCLIQWKRTWNACLQWWWSNSLLCAKINYIVSPLQPCNSAVLPYLAADGETTCETPVLWCFNLEKSFHWWNRKRIHDILIALLMRNKTILDLVQPSGPRLNIKTVLSTYGDVHVKDKTAVRTSYL